MWSQRVVEAEYLAHSESDGTTISLESLNILAQALE